MTDQLQPADLADLLCHALLADHRTVEQIAREVGISGTTIYGWRKGQSLGSVAAYLALLETCGYVVTIRRPSPPKL